MRTVAAFCAEEKVIKLYADELKEPGKRSFRRGQGAGVFYGVSQFFLFSSYALALWYGSQLMSKELATFKSVMKSFMVLIVTALAMGEALAMAPDIIKGNQMASSVFEILDRKTEVQIDTGDDIKKVEGVIQLRDVEFRYPSRSEEQEIDVVAKELATCKLQLEAKESVNKQANMKLEALLKTMQDLSEKYD